MNRAYSCNWCGDRSSRSRPFIDTLDKDDKEEKKYSAEEKEVDEVEVKKSVSERKREIERRISEEQDKKKEPQPVTVKRSESKEKKDFKEVQVEKQDAKSNIDDLSKSEKETCEEKSISPEPANLSFDEKRLSFELGTLIKEKPEKKVDLTQKFLESEKVVYQMMSGTESEPELTFQEKRLSFEKGLMKTVDEKPEILTQDPKATKKFHMETIEPSETTINVKTEGKVISETTKETKLFEGVTKGLSDFKEKEVLVTEAQGIISPKVSTTPPPSPADVLKAKAGEEWKSTPTSDTDGASKSPPKKPDDLFIKTQENPNLLPEFSKDSQLPTEYTNAQLKSPPVSTILCERVIQDDKVFGNPFVPETGSPSIFRRPHQAADYVIFDDEDWDTQDIIEFSDVTAHIVPGNDPYVPEKFFEDSSKGELHQKKVKVFDEPLSPNKTVGKVNVGLTEFSEQSNIFLPSFSQSNIEKSGTPIVETKTTTTTFQTSTSPGEITVTKVESEKMFQPFHGQHFTFNDFSKVPDTKDADSINECEMNFQKPEDDLNLDESLNVIVDYADSCKTSTEDLRQNADKSETENLVEIFDVTDDLNVASLESVALVETSTVPDDKAELLRKLDECMLEDFKPRPKGEKKINNSLAKGSENDFSFSLDQEITNKMLSEVKHEPIKDINLKDVPSPSFVSTANDSRNGRFLGSGGESISRLEDELNLLEKLEDQIKMLKEEEAKMKDIKIDSTASRDEKLESKDVLPHQSTYSDQGEIGEVHGETVKDATLSQAQIIANDDIIRALEEAQIVLAADIKDEPEVLDVREEPFEEKTKRRKNRKRRSKKVKECDPDSEENSILSHEAHQKQGNSSKLPKGAGHSAEGTSETEKNSEREFQRMVSQLSVEEVDEALQIWNKDFSPIYPHLQSEREEEQSSSSDQKSKLKDESK